MKIDEKIDVFLTEKKIDQEEYDKNPCFDEEEEVMEELKELAKLFGGKIHQSDQGVSLYPFKKTDGLGDWDVTVDLVDIDPLEFDITINLYNKAIRMGGYFSIEVKDIPNEATIKKIGKWQEKYYNTIEDIIADAKKIGKLSLG